MTERTETIGELPSPTTGRRVPKVLTRAAWVGWLASLVALIAYVRRGEPWTVTGAITVDGLTVLLWVAATFFSGIVHSYARRYMAGTRGIDRFFGRVFAFTLIVAVLVAADSLLLFAVAWLGMGWVMAGLIGRGRAWTHARAAGWLAQRYFLASAGLLGLGFGLLWWHTGATTIAGAVATAGELPRAVVVGAGVALVGAAMVQSALVPFHGWLLASMTAPTPASALMHAGFVNAGGILLVRFAPVVSAELGVMLGIVAVGAASALVGKLLKTVQADAKGQLGCSTVGQMGFMIMQAGLGFFSAAVAHLILHGFYKTFQFLGSGAQIAHEPPDDGERAPPAGAVGLVVTAATALLGGLVFTVFVGKGAGLDSGVVLTVLVVLMVVHATRQVVARAELPAAIRYGAVPTIALPAIAVYGGVFTAVEALLSDLPGVSAPTELTVVHALVVGAFLVAYVGIDRGLYRDSRRLYVALLNAGQPAPSTVVTAREEYDDA